MFNCAFQESSSLLQLEIFFLYSILYLETPTMLATEGCEKGPKDCWEALEQESAGSRRPARDEVVHRLRKESGFPSAND